ncbi:MAG: amidase, partial [Alphaproteobacteria bacterium]|nr:amidase [Alphaproteobacteria bacterium]
MALPPDPLKGGGLRGYARELRAGAITAEAATRAYLERIAALDPKIQSYECVDRAGALAA